MVDHIAEAEGEGGDLMLYDITSKDTADLHDVEQVPLPSIGWMEKDLEDLLAQNIDHLIFTEHLFVILQERRMQEEPDILALDSEGRLYLFELKRFGAEARNVLQLLRYGQKFGRFTYDELQHLFHSYLRRKSKVSSGSSLPSLQQAHRRYFELSEPLATRQFNNEQTFVLVTNGLDLETREVIEYWNAKGLPVRSLVYRVFRTENDSLLLDFDPFSPYPESVDQVQGPIFVVNTNASHDPEAYKEMLEEDIAAAYYDKKRTVMRIKKGATVLLYHSEVGFIAIGKALSDYRMKTSRLGDPDEVYYIPCDFEVKVDPVKEPAKAVPARVINRNPDFNKRYSFRQTVQTIPKGVMNFIKDGLKRRHKEEGLEQWA